MKNPRQFELLINVGTVIVGVIIVGYIVFAAFQSRTEGTCSATYPAPARFSLHTSEGKPLTAIQLQARAGLRDLGVIDNAAVVQAPGAPSPDVLEVKLRRLPGDADASARARNGVEFRWAPPNMAKASATCLTYSIWLPEKFDFGGGGFLPGVFGGKTAGEKPADGTISVAPQWDTDGRPAVSVTLESGEIRRMMGSAAALPTNRWIKLEQETVLNEPGQANGRVRLWVDGKLIIEDSTLPLRDDTNALLKGVLAAIGYRGLPATQGTVRLSPLEISVR